MEQQEKRSTIDWKFFYELSAFTTKFTHFRVFSRRAISHRLLWRQKKKQKATRIPNIATSGHLA
jgi:hypothetical protein